MIFFFFKNTIQVRKSSNIKPLHLSLSQSFQLNNTCCERPSPEASEWISLPDKRDRSVQTFTLLLVDRCIYTQYFHNNTDAVQLENSNKLN